MLGLRLKDRCGGPGGVGELITVQRRSGRDCGFTSSSLAALARGVRVDLGRSRRRRHSIRSGARCEEALSGTALGGIAIYILTFLSGNGWAKFRRNFCFCQKFDQIGCLARVLWVANWRGVSLV